MEWICFSRIHFHLGMASAMLETEVSVWQKEFVKNGSTFIASCSAESQQAAVFLITFSLLS